MVISKRLRCSRTKHRSKKNNSFILEDAQLYKASRLEGKIVSLNHMVIGKTKVLFICGKWSLERKILYSHIDIAESVGLAH